MKKLVWGYCFVLFLGVSFFLLSSDGFAAEPDQTDSSDLESNRDLVNKLNYLWDCGDKTEFNSTGARMKVSYIIKEFDTISWDQIREFVIPYLSEDRDGMRTYGYRLIETMVYMWVERLPDRESEKHRPELIKKLTYYRTTELIQALVGRWGRHSQLAAKTPHVGTNSLYATDPANALVDDYLEWRISRRKKAKTQTEQNLFISFLRRPTTILPKTYYDLRHAMGLLHVEYYLAIIPDSISPETYAKFKNRANPHCDFDALDQ